MHGAWPRSIVDSSWKDNLPLYLPLPQHLDLLLRRASPLYGDAVGDSFYYFHSCRISTKLLTRIVRTITAMGTRRPFIAYSWESWTAIFSGKLTQAKATQLHIVVRKPSHHNQNLLQPLPTDSSSGSSSLIVKARWPTSFVVRVGSPFWRLCRWAFLHEWNSF